MITNLNKQTSGDPIALTDITTTTTSNHWSTNVSSTLYTSANTFKMPEDLEEGQGQDVFKQITSLLGIKIINVTINHDSVILYGRRNRKKFIIEIKGYNVDIKNAEGELLTTISLSIPYMSSGPYTYTSGYAQQAQTQPNYQYYYSTGSNIKQ